MYIFLVIVHIIVSVAMIAIVLLQSGKGAEMGASFGAGGSQSVFGAGGGNTFMSKMTTGAAIIFMLTSMTLAYMSSHTGTSSIMSGAPRKASPRSQGTLPPAPPVQGQPGAAPAKPAQPVQQTPAPAPAPAGQKK